MSATKKPAGKQVTGKRPTYPETVDLEAQVAEAAYYLAEQRGFCPGYELDDWLAAEAQVKERYATSSDTSSEPPPVGAK